MGYDEVMVETAVESGIETENIGEKIEGRIVEGRKIIIKEDERIGLKEKIEARGIDLSRLEGLTLDSKGKKVNALIGQGDKLEKALGGREELKKFLSAALKGIIKGERKNEIDSYLSGFFIGNSKDGESLTYYDLNSGDLVESRAVAIISAAYRILKIVSAESAEESEKWQTNDQTNEFLRERVIMGWEKVKIKKGEESVAVLSEPLIQEEMPRIKLDTKRRTLPVGGLEVIVDALLGK